MKETVKIVKGYAIERTVGTRGFYEVTIKKGDKWKAYLTFRSAKQAERYINEHL